MAIRYTEISFRDLDIQAGKYYFTASISLGETNWIGIHVTTDHPTKPGRKKQVFYTSKMMHFLRNRDSLYTKLEANFIKNFDEKIHDLSPEIKTEVVHAIRKYFMTNLPLLRKSIF
ncbi:hypothetical protein [Saccharicrinis sp. 156]|uniref:hypothetical protein n=1 Tax=Saccharicrinis sp. 156 TaxID=3417574 RepID=UPI003D3335BB